MADKSEVEIVRTDVTLEDIVAKKCSQHDESGEDNSLLITDLGDIVQKYRDWQEALPDVEPFYAVKCNDDPEILSILVKLGLSFDCASQEEIRLIRDLGADGRRIIYANTTKPVSMIKYAASNGIELMTFDNEEELVKISKCYPSARLVLRIKTEETFSGILYDLRSKYGCLPRDTRTLFKRAKALALNIVGVCFHVGSGCQNPEAYTAAIKASRDVFNVAKEEGFDLDLLDIGGGFLGEVGTKKQFVQISSTIHQVLKEYFSDPRVRVIAEPGRYFVQSSQTLCIKVIGKRVDYTSSDNPPQQGKLRSSSNATCIKDIDAFNDESSDVKNTERVNEQNGKCTFEELNESSQKTDKTEKANENKSKDEKLISNSRALNGTDCNVDTDDVVLQKYVHYFMNDGLYGHLAIIYFEPVDNMTIKVLKKKNHLKERYPSTLWGPSCDSLDMIWAGIHIPELEVGDWLYFIDSGAYWSSMVTNFNRIPHPTRVYISHVEI